MAWTDIAGAVSNPVGSIIGGIAGAISGNSQTNKQIKAQQESQQRQNEWQSAENDKDRQWQDEQWMKQFGMTNEQWQKQFDSENAEWFRRFNLENEYNSPSAQAARLKAAGINPAAVMSDMSGGLAAAGGSGSVAPGGVQGPGQMPSHSVSPLGVSNPSNASSSAQMFSSVAQMLEAVTSAQRLGLDTTKYESTIKAYLDKMDADTRRSDAASRLDSAMALIWETEMPNKIRAEIDKLIADSYEANTRGDMNKANQLLSKAQERFNSLKGDIVETNKSKFSELLDSMIEDNKQRVVTNKAAAQEHLAGADLKRAQAATDEELRAGRSLALNYANEIAFIDKKMSEHNYADYLSTRPERLHLIFAQAEQAGIITQTLKANLDKAIAEGDWAEIRQALGALNQVTSSFKDVASGIGDLKNVGVNIKNAESRRMDALTNQEKVKLQEEFNRSYNRQHRSTEVRSRNDDGSISIEKIWE